MRPPSKQQSGKRSLCLNDLSVPTRLFPRYLWNRAMARTATVLQKWTPNNVDGLCNAMPRGRIQDSEAFHQFRM